MHLEIGAVLLSIIGVVFGCLSGISTHYFRKMIDRVDEISLLIEVRGEMIKQIKEDVTEIKGKLAEINSLKTKVEVLSTRMTSHFKDGNGHDCPETFL